MTHYRERKKGIPKSSKTKKTNLCFFQWTTHQGISIFIDPHFCFLLLLLIKISTHTCNIYREKLTSLTMSFTGRSVTKMITKYGSLSTGLHDSELLRQQARFERITWSDLSHVVATERCHRCHFRDSMPETMMKYDSLFTCFHDSLNFSATTTPIWPLPCLQFPTMPLLKRWRAWRKKWNWSLTYRERERSNKKIKQIC